MSIFYDIDSIGITLAKNLPSIRGKKVAFRGRMRRAKSIGPLLLREGAESLGASLQEADIVILGNTQINRLGNAVRNLPSDVLFFTEDQFLLGLGEKRYYLENSKSYVYIVEDIYMSHQLLVQSGCIGSITRLKEVEANVEDYLVELRTEGYQLKAIPHNWETLRRFYTQYRTQLNQNASFPKKIEINNYPLIAYAAEQSDCSLAQFIFRDAKATHFRELRELSFTKENDVPGYYSMRSAPKFIGQCVDLERLSFSNRLLSNISFDTTRLENLYFVQIGLAYREFRQHSLTAFPEILFRIKNLLEVQLFQGSLAGDGYLFTEEDKKKLGECILDNACHIYQEQQKEQTLLRKANAVLEEACVHNSKELFKRANTVYTIGTLRKKNSALLEKSGVNIIQSVEDADLLLWDGIDALERKHIKKTYLLKDFLKYCKSKLNKRNALSEDDSALIELLHSDEVINQDLALTIISNQDCSTELQSYILLYYFKASKVQQKRKAALVLNKYKDGKKLKHLSDHNNLQLYTYLLEESSLNKHLILDYLFTQLFSNSTENEELIFFYLLGKDICEEYRASILILLLCFSDQAITRQKARRLGKKYFTASLQDFVLQNWNPNLKQMKELFTFFTQLKSYREVSIPFLLRFYHQRFISTRREHRTSPYFFSFLLKHNYVNIFEENSFKDLPRALNIDVDDFNESIFKFKGLNYLSIYSHEKQLETLPYGLSQLQKLWSLNLESNALSTLPSDIDKIYFLRELDLSYNKFETIPAVVFNCLNLIKLHLNNNPLKGIPSAIAQLQKLQELDISGIPGGLTATVCQILSQFPMLRVLRLSEIQEASDLKNVKFSWKLDCLYLKEDELTEEFIQFLCLEQHEIKCIALKHAQKNFWRKTLSTYRNKIKGERFSIEFY